MGSSPIGPSKEKTSPFGGDFSLALVVGLNAVDTRRWNG